MFGKFFSNRDCIFKNCKLHELNDVYKLIVGLYMYKILKQNKYQSLQDILDISYPDHTHDTRTSFQLVLPFPWTNAVRQSFILQFIKIWNDIPIHI